MRPRRPRWLRRISRTAAGRALGLPAAASGWTAQPFRLRVTDLVLPAAGPSRGLAGLRAAFLSDLHVRHPDRGVAPRVVRLLRDLDPDLVFVGGDTHDHPRWTAAAAEHIGRYPARRGVFVVPGNHEHRRGVDLGAFGAALAARGATLLRNESRVLPLDDGPPVAVVGVDDPATRRHDLDAALRGVPAGTFAILLAHAGILFEEAEARGVPLVLTGHSHGGQVRLPLLGIPWLPRRVGPCVEDLHRRDGTTMFVTTGAGMSVLPVRYGCPPEVVRIRWEAAAE